MRRPLTTSRLYSFCSCAIVACVAYVSVCWSSSPAGEFGQIRDRVSSDKPEKHKPEEDDDDDDDDHHHRKRGAEDDDDSFISIFLSALFSDDDHHHYHHHHGYHHDIHYHYDKYDYDRYDRAFDDSLKTGPRRPGMFFARYPYAEGQDGYMMYSDFMTARPETCAARVQFQYGTDFNDVNRYTGKALIEGTGRWGLDAEWNYYTEWIRPGVQDNLHVGDVNVLFRIIQTPGSIWRLGLGMNWFESGLIDEVGLNATFRLDYFPRPPVIFSGELEYGGLGESEMLHGGFTLGLNWRHAELFTGYDYRRLAGIELQGPVFGFRVWW